MTVLHGFALAGFRSFGPDLQYFGSLQQVNLIAGQNNAGKSNVLRFVRDFLCNKDTPIPAGIDPPRGRIVGAPYRIAIAQQLDEEMIRNYLGERADQLARRQSELNALLESSALRPTGDDLVWLEFEVPTAQPGRPALSGLSLSVEQVQQVLDDLTKRGLAYRDTPARLAAAFANRTGGTPAGQVKTILNIFDPRRNLPTVEVVEAFREIRQAGEGNLNNGTGLIDELAMLRDPNDPLNESGRRRFEDINVFLRSILDDPSATLSIPYDRKTLHVLRDGTTLPLSSYGTGVHQVVILAAAATAHRDKLVCIEEPEVHLHPLMQRKLIRYLSEKTDNQYLIATHSAHMLDYENARVYHLRLTSNGSRVDAVVEPHDVVDLCADLGYRPSDLLQANAVIWVEGPSDRTYLRFWIAERRPDLIEGIHFSIMFFGGGLVSHLTVDEGALERFIKLRAINRHSAIMIDSDLKSSTDSLNSTKQRIRDEFQDGGPGLAWITDGYTIEDYAPLDVMQRAVLEVHPNIPCEWDGDQWSNPLRISKTTKGGNPVKLDKIAIAHAAVGLWSNPFENKELLNRVTQIVEFVDRANVSPREAVPPDVAL